MFSTLLLPFFAVLLTLSAAFPHDHSSLSARHNRLVRRRVQPPPVQDEPPRCRKNNNSDSSKQDSNSQVSNDASGAGLIKVTSSEWGSSGATRETTSTSGPNGSIYWLNNGIDKSTGWNPPNVTVSDLVYRDLKTVTAEPNNIYEPCAPYVQMFEEYGEEFGVPPIMMAAFAMQESSCNPDAVGEGGEQGLMQISKDKCGGAPNGNCKDPAFNIRTATKFFHDLLESHFGNVLLCLGAYNGWFPGMTLGDATAAAKSSCCRCQQDLAYIHDMVNGGLQGIDSHELTVPQPFNNLAICITV